MPRIDSEMIRQVGKVVKDVSKPNVFSVVIALAALAFLGLICYQDSKRADAQVAAMAAIVVELKDHSDKITDIHNWCCTVQPVAQRASSLPAR